jgi:hypothetical protein
VDFRPSVRHSIEAPCNTLPIKGLWRQRKKTFAISQCDRPRAPWIANIHELAAKAQLGGPLGEDSPGASYLKRPCAVPNGGYAALGLHFSSDYLLLGRTYRIDISGVSCVGQDLRQSEGRLDMFTTRRKLELLAAYASITTTILLIHLAAFASGLWWY